MAARDEMLRIPIWNPATPSFVSAVAHVYGTGDDIDRMMSARAEILHERGDDEPDSLIGAWDAWRMGRRNVTVGIACSDQAFATPVRVERRCELRFDRLSQRWNNIWDCAYDIEITGAIARLVWIEDVEPDDGLPEFRRVMRLSADEMLIGGRPVSMAWGEPGAIVFGEDGHPAVESTVYLFDRAFGDMATMEQDMANPARVDISSFIEQVIADG